MRKALGGQFEVRLLCDRREGILRKAYRLLGSSLLTRKWVWEKAGKRIAKLLIPAKPDVVVLLTDVTAGAIPYLKREGIKTVLSIEDLSAEWLGILNKEATFSILNFYASLSDAAITVSNKLRKKLIDIGIEATVVKPGLERTVVSLEEAINRKEHSPILLHAGQIQFDEEKTAFETAINLILRKYSVMAYSYGPFVSRIKASLPEVSWYNFSSSVEAAQNLKMCTVGFIIRFRAHNPTRLYFHASMLQPLIAIGDNWVAEVTDHSLGVVTDPGKTLDAMDKIVNNYLEYVNAIKKYATDNTLEKTYEPLIRMIDR